MYFAALQNLQGFADSYIKDQAHAFRGYGLIESVSQGLWHPTRVPLKIVAVDCKQGVHLQTSSPSWSQDILGFRTVVVIIAAQI